MNGGKMKAQRFLLFVSLMVTLILAACAVTTPERKSPESAAPVTTPFQPSTRKVFRILEGVYPDLLDPQKMSVANELAVLRLCYEGITLIDAKGNIGPGAADKWEVSKDGTAMTFHIREGLRRADGTPMNASDYEYALLREVDPRVTGKAYADIVRDVTGADALIAQEGQKISDADLAKLYSNYGVQADDATRQLVIRFRYPVGFWDYIAYTWVTYPTAKQSAESSPDWWIKPENHKCNGPYQIKTLEVGKRTSFEANSNYWRGKPKIDRIEITYVSDGVAALAAYANGEFDETFVTSATIAQVETEVNLKAEFYRYPMAQTSIIAFNNARRPFDDKNVRIAFSQAIDREGWIRDVQKSVGTPYTRWIPPGVPGAQPDKPGAPAYDPKAAVETLIQANYGKADGKSIDCAKLGELKLTYPATAQNHVRYQFLAGNFVRVFNCPITLDPVDATVYNSLNKGDLKTRPQIFPTGWIQDYPHPQNWLSLYWSCGARSLGRWGYCNKDVDALLLEADQTTNFGQAIKLYQQAEDLVLSDVPGAPLSNSESLFVLKPYIVGPKNYPSSGDAWLGEWGPIWTYDIDLTLVPDSYPRK
jgi:oligopeptide transport system substrate-binding protein